MSGAHFSQSTLRPNNNYCWFKNEARPEPLYIYLMKLLVVLMLIVSVFTVKLHQVTMTKQVTPLSCWIRPT